MAVYYSAAVRQTGTMFGTALSHVNGEMVLTLGYRTVTLDGLHRRQSVEHVRYDNQLAQALEQLQMRYAIYIDGNPITTALSVRLSEILNI